LISCTASKRVRLKFFICATTFLTLHSLYSIRQNPLDGRFRCTVQYCLCCLARSGLLIPTHSSPDLVRSSTFEYSRSSLTIPAQFTKHHAQLRTAYALHYRTRRQNATLLRRPDGNERALTTRLLSPLQSRHKSMFRWSPTSPATCLSRNSLTTYSTYVGLDRSKASVPTHSSLRRTPYIHLRFSATHLYRCATRHT
jgi:hypothetical protein